MAHMRTYGPTVFHTQISHLRLAHHGLKDWFNGLQTVHGNTGTQENTFELSFFVSVITVQLDVHEEKKRVSKKLAVIT